ncbi:Spo0B C-terminal domain-containing protein [Bacillus sp. FJAT-47783]|uniref:Spo0B C-terminal domain-containing protein n=1 Tax=Bacillus sp. FJAT-47783 TaxID=2922712 RepID=UPI001FAC5595|nr:Spo0B C-terminal domain-containing protein [Bacillus sp. FJAT-47783]
MKKREESWSIVEILSHSRHDWMNKLQLLKGNLALKKYDRAKEIIDEIVIEAQHESKLSNLHMNSFAEYIITYNWLKSDVKIEYVVLGDVLNLSTWDVPLTKWAKKLFSLLEVAALPKHDHEMMLTIETDREEGARFSFSFQGILKETDEINAFLTTQPFDRMKIQQMTCDRNEVTVHVTVDSEEAL